MTSKNIAEESRKDPVLSELIKKLRTSSNYDSEFSINGDIIFRDDRVYIPESLCPAILSELHSTHSGITKMKQLARRYVYWPKIDADIEKLVRSCKPCKLAQKSPQKVPLHVWEEPEENFDRIHIDFAGPKNGYQFLVLVDAKSKWPEVEIFSNPPSTETTIQALEEIFLVHGYPKLIVSDNASIFTSSKFKKYCEDRGILQAFSAPGYPATNGLAERNVQSLKLKLDKMDENPESTFVKIKEILRHFRATPLQGGKSPAELYLKQKYRIQLDAILPSIRKPNTSAEFPIQEFSKGERVEAQVHQKNKLQWKFGKVVRRLGRLHYEVQLDHGYVLKRHINQLQKSGLPEPENQVQKSSSPEPENHMKAKKTEI